MPNANPENFTRAELADVYEKIVLFHEQYDFKAAPLSTKAKGYRKLVNKLGLEVKRFTLVDDLNQQPVPLCDGKQSRLWFYDSQGNSLHSIFKHLRNAAAHADIKRKKLSGQIWYCIEHKFGGKLKLLCQMKKADFWAFVAEAKKIKSQNGKTD